MVTRMEWETDADDSDQLINNTNLALAQVFTLGGIGPNLAFVPRNVKLKIYRVATPGLVTVEIFQTTPGIIPDTTGTPLATGTTDGDALGTLASTNTPWTTIDLTSTATLNRDTAYCIKVSVASATAVNKLGWRFDTAGSSYIANGLFYFDTLGNDVWGFNADDVGMFEIGGGEFTGTLCTMDEAINKAGTNAATNAINEVLINRFVLQAEGVINAVTRFDWVDAYSAISDDVKFILNQTASDLAAIYIITYDMSGYTASTVEAETMINVYREAVARGLSLLRNQEVKDFITGDS